MTINQAGETIDDVRALSRKATVNRATQPVIAIAAETTAAIVAALSANASDKDALPIVADFAAPTVATVSAAAIVAAL